MTLISALFNTARPKTLIVSLAVILLGQTLAWYDSSRAQDIHSFNWTIALFCLLCCCFLQISVNLANDYFDGKAGIDGPSRLGPIRASQTGELSHQQLRNAMIYTCIIAIITGLYLVYKGGWPFILLGLFSLAGVFSYSGGRKPLASNALGEIAVFIFFGWIAVIASYYLQTLHFNPALLFPASEIGLLVAAIMLVNNIRDIPTDSLAGKNTLAVLLGANKSKTLYYCLLLLPFISISVNPYSPWLNGMLLPFHAYLCWLMKKRSGQQLNKQLSQTSFVVLLWVIGYLGSLFLS